VVVVAAGGSVLEVTLAAVGVVVAVVVVVVAVAANAVIVASVANAVIAAVTMTTSGDLGRAFASPSLMTGEP
jgi:hypothetical protein